MTPRTPTDADLTKLHARVNQYIGQRFTISMTAIAIFGVVLGWMILGLVLSASPETQVKPSMFLIAIILLFVLSILFLYSQILLRDARIVVAYLRGTGVSVWEQDYSQFNKKHPSKMSRHHAVFWLFQGLGFMAWTSPFALIALYPAEAGTETGIFGTALVFFGLLYTALLFWLRESVFFGKDADERWKAFWEDGSGSP